MCDCWMCNQTEEEIDEGLIEWEYEKYVKKTENPLSMDDWLQSLPSPNKKESNNETI